MSGEIAVRPLERVPELAVGPVPALGVADAARVESERRRLAAHPALVDGPVLMVAAAAPERLVVYPATYAWHTADRAEPLQGTHGALGVQLALVGEGGAILWQRRSDTVDHPGGWTISVAGTAVPGPGLDEQIAAEAAEELGLGPDDLLGLRPMALVDDRRGRTVQVVFRAGLSPAARIVPHPAEVSETRLAAVYPGEGPVELMTAAWWRELVRLAARDG
ncbi:MAG TPA: NUDIX domain-containing protein [Gaiellales bacterium]|nr:NUDIX domain-containing protein [Gaiellales bacterium]